MLHLLDRFLCRHVALFEHGKQGAIFVVLVVDTLLIKRKESRKLHNLASRTQPDLASTVGKIDGGPLHPRRRHLAGQCALVNQVIELGMVTRPRLVFTEIGGTNGFVRFLRVFCLSLVNPRFVGQIAGIIAASDGTARCRDSARVHLDAIGTHISDRTILVEVLGDPHRVAGRKTKLAGCFLLQG